MTEADARERASHAAAGRGFTERLAEGVGATARASAVFGEPVERKGVTVIPVARAKWGFGGGSGGRNGEEGAGGGGGTSVSPVGFIELRGGGARFRRIHNPAQIAVATAACGLSAAIAFRLVRRRRAPGGRKGLARSAAGLGVRRLVHRRASQS